MSGLSRIASWLLLARLCLPSAAAAQSSALAARPARYWISLADKAGVAFDPAAYFSPAAQARRHRQGLPAYEASDLPVRPDYLARVRAGCDTITLVSRWFNAVACRATTATSVPDPHRVTPRGGGTSVLRRGRTWGGIEGQP